MSRPPERILVVDDEAVVRDSLGAWLRQDGFEVVTAADAREARQALAAAPFALALVDIQMPGTSGLELLPEIVAGEAAPVCIIITAYASVDTAVQALKAGAWDYLVKPFDPDELTHLVRRALEHRELQAENRQLRGRLDEVSRAPAIVGASRAMRELDRRISKVAPTDSTVLVTGESGTGKELVARHIHARSRRRHRRLVIVHCGALAEGILESELFGHEKGAFTGAASVHQGKFEQADGGTIFLDEIGDVSPRVQVELLRVLEERRVTRVGGSGSIPVDFRVVAATNRDLPAMIEAGEFREELFWRLNVVPVRIPPLRERPEDILALADYFLADLGGKMNRRGLEFTPAARRRLQAYSWPGNVRELQNAIERAVVLASGPVIDVGDLPRSVRDGAGGGGGPAPVPGGPISLAELERRHIAATLTGCAGNVSEAARVLGIDRSTLYAKMRRYGLGRPEAEAGSNQ
ncbi:MAG: sigma-54-dependent Fis family transcriptional regulator [Planctomycetota bacterium]|nr:MAG: sigma-54-dependent Fis family transcriptional regulator [Planctomycetota bacterium]